MNSQDPNTCHFLACSSKSPVHCYEAFKGKYLHSYTVLDNFKKVENVLSVSYNISGKK